MGETPAIEAEGLVKNYGKDERACPVGICSASTGE